MNFMQVLFVSSCVGMVVAICGCTTYTSPFVHKSEAELDAMEAQSVAAAEAFTTGDYATSEQILARLGSEQTVSSPQYEMERVSVLLHQGKHKEAHELMQKIRIDLEMLFDEKSEKEAMSLWHGENKKVFKGDSHERATFYALFALSFLERGEWEDAERCVKNGLLCDSANTRETQYNSDYVLLYYIGYVACKRSGRGSDAEEYLREMARVIGDSKSIVERIGNLTMPNAFLVVWGGVPPSYARGGEYDEIRHVIPGTPNPFSYLSVRHKGMEEFLALDGFADINFQATTRGGREMDSVLKDKAAVKSGMEASGNILIVAGMGCFAAMGSGDAKVDLVLGCAGVGCFLLGGTFYIVGECINSEADIRSWKTLPGEFLVVPLSLPEGQHELELNGYRLRDQVARRKIGIDVKTNTIAVAHTSIMHIKTLSNPTEMLLNSSVDIANAAVEPPSKNVPAEINIIENKGGVK